MSMLQTSSQLKPCPLASEVGGGTYRHVYYFQFANNLDCSAVQANFPSAERCGIAWLPNWVWHINTNGQPNIRKAYEAGVKSKKHQLLPYPSADQDPKRPSPQGVFGYLFKISVQDDSLIHQLMSRHQVLRRFSQYVYITKKYPPGIKRTMESLKQLGQRTERHAAIMYLDPINTRDVSNTCDFRNMDFSIAEKNRWATGIAMMRKSGVPSWYLQKIFSRLRGFWDLEPIYVLGWVHPTVDMAQRMVEKHMAYIESEKAAKIAKIAKIAKKRKADEMLVAVGISENGMFKRRKIMQPSALRNEFIWAEALKQ